jgi:hypothetical protein
MIPTWGTSTGRNLIGGVPSLLLDFSSQSYFLNGTGYAAFGGSPGITFSRGTNATMIDSTGQLTYAPSNMLLNSESFGGASWFPTGLAATPVVSNITAAPDETITADKIVENNIDTTHYIAQTNAYTASVTYTASIYAKAAERQYVQIILTTAAFGSALTAGFDLSGSGSTVTSAGSTSSITSVGNGWYRCSIRATATTSASTGVQIRLAGSLSTTPASYQGDNTSGLYLWGAQLGAVTYETAPRAYNSTTPKNLLGYTEEFNVTTSGWTKFNSTITANATTDPNGNLNADKLVEQATTQNHNVNQAFSFVAGVPYTYSVYAKAAERQYIQIIFTTPAYSGNFIGVFNLSGNGATAVNVGGLTSSITSVGNGWYRCSITSTATTAGSATPQIRVTTSFSTTAASSTYLGDGTSGVYLWGAQLSDSASMDPYVYNPAAALTSTAYYGPRFDYNPNYAYSTNNLIPYANPQDFSNASFWSKPRASAPATTATADPAETYTAYKLTEDTATGTHLIAWQGLTRSVTAGVQYTISGYLKLADAARSTVALSLGVDNGAFAVASGGDLDLSTGNVTNPTGNGVTVVNAGNGWYRWYITATAAASAIFIMRINLLSGGTISYTGDGTSGVYIWGAQLVTGSAPVPFFYYPLNPLGLLIEEARTNLLLNSQTLSTQNITTTAQAYTLSFYGTGTVTLSGTSTAGPLVGTGVFPNRVSLTFTPTAGTLTLTVTGTVSNAQLEAGGFVTSYIPTAGASVTRSADVATMVGNNFTNWYNQTAGTLTVEFNASANGFATYVSASNGTITQNSAHIDNDTGIMRAVYYSGSALVTALGLGAISTVGATNKIATAYAVNDFAASRNGGTVATDTTLGAVPVSLTQLNIGADDRLLAANYTSNHIKTISYYNTRLPDDQLQALTA